MYFQFITFVPGIGFDWTIKHPLKDFERRLNDLIAYRDVYGTCDVPSLRSESNPYQSLGNWCYNLRRAYKLKQEAEENPEDAERLLKLMKKQYSITDEKIKRLKDVGFEFDK